MMRALAIAIVAALAAPAHADVWKHAVEGKETQDVYDAALAEGDAFATRANAKSLNATQVSKLVDQAIDQYQQASKARPTEGEPYYRIAMVLESYFTDCSTYTIRGVNMPPTCIGNGRVDLKRAEQTVLAWEEFEKRASLDPRLADSLFSRAILRTKLVQSSKDPKRLLEGALADYRALLDRTDGLTMSPPEQIWGNLAETYMMLGKMEEAIEAYHIALRLGGDSSTAYGLAVALDRDGSPAEALEVIRSQSEQAFVLYRQRYSRGEIFYVPAGEEYYYLALVYEAWDRIPQAIEFWRQFIRSGAHPQFQGRAKQHLDALQAKVKAQPGNKPGNKLQRQPYEPYDW
jgi:tetratricopeptide (TPR) repeat protein